MSCLFARLQQGIGEGREEGQMIEIEIEAMGKARRERGRTNSGTVAAYPGTSLKDLPNEMSQTCF